MESSAWQDGAGPKSSPCKCFNIKYEHQFASQLFHFLSNSLLVAWGSSTEWRKALRPCTCIGDTRAPGFWVGISLAEAVAATWEVDQLTENLCFSFSL